MGGIVTALRDALGATLIECGARLLTDETKVRLLGRLRGDDPTVGAWPWCDACHSWHHPDNPTCRARVDSVT